MSKETPDSGSGPQPTRGLTSKHELFVFAVVLLALEGLYFSDALQPGFVLSAADWLLATESFRTPGEPEYEPVNRLLTDIACQMEPWTDLAAREWQAGRVPLWNPYAGCGAPLLANAQSGVFNPINFIYFLTRSPYAWVAMAMLKLFIAGIGAFLLASELGLARLGRWFAGLCFPFSGFAIVWLQYPMGSVAVWLPMVLWLVERLLHRPGAARAAWLALVLAIMHLGGHPETAAHILVIAGMLVLWRTCTGDSVLSTSANAGTIPGVPSIVKLAPLGWFVAAAALSYLIAAVQLVPLAEYLKHSQAWAERSAAVRSPLALRKPHLLAIPALAVPYVYGSYLRGHPHVEKALGVENFNEIAGGYTGLTTLAVLVPLAFRARRRHRWVWFWLTLDILSIAAVYRLPVVDNFLRLIPVLNVTQNERLLLVVSLAHCLLGGAGLEAWSELAASQWRRLRRWMVGLLVGGAVLLACAAMGIKHVDPQIRQRAERHFAHQAEIRGLPSDALAHRADQMAAQASRFFPRYYFAVGAYATCIAVWLVVASRFSRKNSTQTRNVSEGATANGGPRSRFGLVWIVVSLGDLFLFGRGYNPAIPLEQYFPENDRSVTNVLREPAGQELEPYRVLSMEEEFPPNVLARYGIADIRNYDAIEVRRSLEFLGPLWADGSGRLTSNSWTTWPRVHANLDRLSLANVRYLISTSSQAAGGVVQHGRVGVHQLEHWGRILQSPGEDPFGDGQGNQIAHRIVEYRPGRIEAAVDVPADRTLLVFSETFMPGWTATIDGVWCAAQPFRGAFIGVPITPGQHRVVFHYGPVSFRIGVLLSAIGLIVTLFLLAISCFGRKSPA